MFLCENITSLSIFVNSLSYHFLPNAILREQGIVSDMQRGVDKICILQYHYDINIIFTKTQNWVVLTVVYWCFVFLNKRDDIKIKTVQKFD